METNDCIYVCYKYEGNIRVEKWCIYKKEYKDNHWEYHIIPSFITKTYLKEFLIVDELDLAGEGYCKFAFSAKCALLKYIMYKNDVINNIMQYADDISECNDQIEELYKEIKEAKELLERYL